MHTTNSGSYSAPAKLFHWLIVALLVIQYTVGWLMPDVEHDTQPVGLISWHLSVGVFIVLVVLMRLVWRLTHRPAIPAQSGSAFLQRIARATHGLLYLLLVALPLMGWANASSRGWSVQLFGVIPLPALSAKDSWIGDQLGDIHQITAWVLIAVVGLHVAAALYHQYILKDGTLKRMLP
ncbi:cytochrome b [Glaciimonas sp. GG7]